MATEDIQNLIHVDTNEFGINIDATEDKFGMLALTISVDSRSGWIESLTADTEKAIRIGDLFTAARALIRDGGHSEYARGMAELIGSFAPEGDQFDSENMREALGKFATRS